MKAKPSVANTASVAARHAHLLEQGLADRSGAQFGSPQHGDEPAHCPANGIKRLSLLGGCGSLGEPAHGFVGLHGVGSIAFQSTGACAVPCRREVSASIKSDPQWGQVGRLATL